MLRRFRSCFLISLLFLAVGGRALAQAPQFDTYGGLVGIACPDAASTGTDVQTAQIMTTSSTPVTPGATQTITLASVTETNGHTLSPGEYLSVDPGSTTPISVAGETPTGAFAVKGGTNASGKWYGDGSTTSFTGWLAHASWVESSLVVEVSGTVVANEVYGALESGPAACPACTNALGAVTGHASPDNGDSRIWVSIQFATAPSNGAQITLNYAYLATEVAKISSVNGSAVTLSNPLWNAHAVVYAVTDGYFTVKRLGSRWNFCDALSHPFIPISIEEFQTQGSFGDLGTVPYLQNSVTTQLTQAVTGSTSPQAVTVASTAGIAPGPGMIVDVGRTGNTNNSSVEWVPVTAVGAGTITGIFKNNHNSGDSVECCQNATLVSGGNGGNAYTGPSLTGAGKYGNSAYPAVNATSNQWITLNIPRLKAWGFNGVSPAGSNSVFDTTTVSSLGIWDLPESTSPFKDPFQYTTYECSDGLYNRFGYAKDDVLDGNSKAGHAQSGKVEDYLDSNLSLWAGGQMTVLPETPWAVVMMPTQTDDCPTWGPGEHFSTWPQNGFQSAQTGKMVLNASPYLAVPSAVVRNKSQQTTQPLSQRGTFISKMVGLPQFLQGQLDPINFPTAASGSNISSISCSGSNVAVTLSGAWLGTHFDPFTVGDIVTVTATGFSTASGLPAAVATALAGSHQVTLAYPGASPCPGAATASSGLIALGPGYQSLADLNSSTVGWGSSYTSWGSSGTLNSSVAITCAGTSCSFPTAGAMDPYSIEITASNGSISGIVAADYVTTAGGPPASGAYTITNVANGTYLSKPVIVLTVTNICSPAGKCLGGGDTITISGVGGCTAANGSWSTINGTSGYNGGPFGANSVAIDSGGSCNGTYTSGGSASFSQSGLFDSMGPLSTYLTQAVTCSTPPCASETFTLNQFANVFPGQIYTITDGANTDYVKVQSMAHNSASYGSVVSITAGPFNHGYASGSGVTFTQTFYNFTATAFQYQSAASISFTIPSALPSGWSLTAQYHANGWANGGTGLADEDGRCAGSASSISPYCAGNPWTGNDNSCVDQGVDADGACNATHAIYGDAAFERDMDGFAQVMAAYYARGYLEQARSVMPHTMIIQSYRDGGARGDPGRRSTLQGQLPFEDAGWASMLERWDGARPAAAAKYPCLAGGSWTLCADSPLGSLDYQFQITGDKPFYDFVEFAADQDSALQCVVGIGTRLGVPCVNNRSGAGGPSSNQTDGFYQATSQADRASFARRWLSTILMTPTINGSYQFVGSDWWAPIDTPLAGGQLDDYGLLTTQDNLYNGQEACVQGVQPPTENIAGYPLVAVPEAPNAANCYGDFLHPWRDNLWSIDSAMLGQTGTPNKLSNAGVTGGGVR
ncbi:MAG TPA: hypothetical protein VGW33_15285 [Terriglobia bacterium]|nr:hypothetical protein [Terriglobia bacterium]